LDETLQLIEAPIADPIIDNISTIFLSDSFEVFHYNLVSIKLGNNIFTDIMINPDHITSFSSRKLLEKPYAGTSAFGLENGTQISEFSFDLLYFGRIIKPAVATDGEVIYSEINAQNSSLRATVQLNGVNLFRECEDEKASTFFINGKQTFLDLPTEILFVAIRDTELKFLSAIKQSQDKNIIFDIGTPWEIVSHGSSVNNGFSFGFLDNPTSLFQTSNSQLAWKFEFSPDNIIDCIMEFEIITDFILPSIINTELQSSFIEQDSFNYFRSCFDSYFSTGSCTHNHSNSQSLFKCIGGEAKFIS
jgi:hypothetical protein